MKKWLRILLICLAVAAVLAFLLLRPTKEERTALVDEYFQVLMDDVIAAYLEPRGNVQEIIQKGGKPPISLTIRSDNSLVDEYTVLKLAESCKEKYPNYHFYVKDGVLGSGINVRFEPQGWRLWRSPYVRVYLWIISGHVTYCRDYITHRYDGEQWVRVK